MPSDDGLNFATQVSVVRQMLPTLQTLTAAGQQNIMSKIVTFTRDQAERARHGLSARNRRMLAELLGHLTHESERLSPGILAFSRRAESLLALIAAGE